MPKAYESVEFHSDGSATIRINPEYLGSCAKCGEEATHAEWVEFEPNEFQRKAQEHINSIMPDFPQITGVWHHVCDACCDPTAKHKEQND